MYIPSHPRALADFPTSSAAHRVSIPGTSHSTAAAEFPPLQFLRHRSPPITGLDAAPQANILATLGDAISRFFFSSSPSFSPFPTTSSLLKKRDSPLQTTNVTIGVTVGVLLTAFIIGTFCFCYRYRTTIRFTSKKKKRSHRKSGSSKSSKSSQSSSDRVSGPSPPAPPPPPPEPAPEG